MLRSFFALSRREQLTLLQAALLLIPVRVGLQIVTYGRLQRSLQTIPTMQWSPELSPERIGWAVETASTVLPGETTCLAEALVAECLLEWRGYEAALRFGVDGADIDLSAHAWVESGDQVVVGGGHLSKYNVLESSDRG